MSRFHSSSGLITVLLVCSILSIVFVRASEDPTSSLLGVSDLTPDNFDTLVGGDRPALVEFYAPWCGHCKSLVPEYARLGEIVSKTQGSSSVVIAKVNADKYRDLGSRFDVKGFPTLKWFPKGSSTPEDYSGGRTTEEFVKFINEKTGSNIVVPSEPSAVVELDPTSFDSIVLNPSSHAMVMFYAPWCGHCKHLKPEWEKLARAFANEKSVVIARVDVDKYRSFGEKYEIKGYPTIKYFPQNSMEAADYSGSRTLEALVSYMNEKARTSRKSDGFLDASAGLVAVMAPYATEFRESVDKAAVIERARAAVPTGSDSSAAQFYVKVMEKLVQDSGYASRQKIRLQRLIESGSVDGDKIDEFTRRMNVLSLFID